MIDQGDGGFDGGLGDDGLISRVFGVRGVVEEVEGEGQARDVGDEVVEVGAKGGVGLGIGEMVETVVGFGKEAVADGVEGEMGIIGVVMTRTHGDRAEVDDGFVPGFEEAGGDGGVGDWEFSGGGLEEEEVGEGARGIEDVGSGGGKEAGHWEEGLGDDESGGIGFALVDAEGPDVEKRGVERGESGGEVGEGEEQATGVLAEVAGDDGRVMGGEVVRGEIGAGETGFFVTGFFGDLKPFVDGEFVVDESVVAGVGEVGLVKDEGMEDEAEEIEGAGIGAGEEGGPEDRADDDVVVETEGAAVADGGGGDGEHGEDGRERVEGEILPGVGAEVAEELRERGARE
jgi:hypothetical protein